MIALFCRIAFLDVQVNRTTKEHVSMPAGPGAKEESPGFFDLMAFFRSPNIFSLRFSADSRTQNLNSDKFDQWRIRRRMWRNMYQYRRSLRRIKDSGRRVDISWQKAKSTRNCGARLRLAPINEKRDETYKKKKKERDRGRFNSAGFWSFLQRSVFVSSLELTRAVLWINGQNLDQKALIRGDATSAAFGQFSWHLIRQQHNIIFFCLNVFFSLSLVTHLYLAVHLFVPFKI